jgi:hypothetical protein
MRAAAAATSRSSSSRGEIPEHHVQPRLQIDLMGDDHRLHLDSTVRLGRATFAATPHAAAG